MGRFFRNRRFCSIRLKVAIWLVWQILLLPVLPVRIDAQTPGRTTGDDEHDAQLWPDVQISFNLRPQWSVFIFGTTRLGRDLSAVTNEQIGFGASRRFGTGLTGSISYRHFHTEAILGRHINEDRIFGDATPRRSIGRNLILVDRNRFEWRRVNGRVMYRYRNRIQLERPVNVGEKRVTPYAAFEAFYDSRSRAWSRFQIYTGTRVPLSKHVTFDGFYMHQWDSRVVPGYLDVIGALWRFEF